MVGLLSLIEFVRSSPAGFSLQVVRIVTTVATVMGIQGA